MRDLLKRLYNACNPALPATAEYYLDMSSVRGVGALTQKFVSSLQLTDDGIFLHLLFSGHIGCGKSSELEQLRRTLTGGEAKCGRYLAVYMNAEEYLDPYDVTTTDILLAVVTEVANALRDEAGIELKNSYFSKRFAEIIDLLFADVEAGEIEIPLWKAKAKIQLLQKDPEARRRVREAILPHTASLLAEINDVLERARLELAKKASSDGGERYKGIVLILDNLEKIQRITGYKEGEESVRELFIERAAQLNGLNAHAVFTVPLRLVRSNGPLLANTYGTFPFVLPMVKVIRRDDGPFEAGRACLQCVLEKRLAGTPLTEAFQADALAWLLTYSGGHTRSLMAYVQQACTYTDGLPISLSSAKKALSHTISLFSTSIHARFWPKLAALELSPDQQIDNNDPDYRDMLEQLFVLEYRNGDDTEDVFQDDAPWYAVHPIVRKLAPFKRAVAEARTQASTHDYRPTD